MQCRDCRRRHDKRPLKGFINALQQPPRDGTRSQRDECVVGNVGGGGSDNKRSVFLFLSRQKKTNVPQRRGLGGEKGRKRDMKSEEAAFAPVFGSTRAQRRADPTSPPQIRDKPPGFGSEEARTRPPLKPHNTVRVRSPIPGQASVSPASPSAGSCSARSPK